MMNFKCLITTASCLFVFGIHANEPFTYKNEKFNCASAQVQLNDNFVARVQATETELKAAGKKHVTLELQDANLEQVRQLGYEPVVVDGKIKLIKWIGKGENTFPTGPTHTISGLGVVQNENGMILCTEEEIIERDGTKTIRVGLPGGKIENNEFTVDGTGREIREEAGMVIQSSADAQTSNEASKLVIISAEKPQLIFETEILKTGAYQASDSSKVFLMKVHSQGKEPIASGEIRKVSWRTPQDIQQHGTTNAYNIIAALAAVQSGDAGLVRHAILENNKVVKNIFAPNTTQFKVKK